MSDMPVSSCPVFWARAGVPDMSREELCMDPKHEHTTNQAPHQRGTPMSSEGQDPRAEMKMRKPEEDVLDVIESVESQLGALRKAHEEHKRAMVTLNEERAAVKEMQEEVEARESELTTREVELAEMRQEFEQREVDLVQRASGLEQRESKIETQAETLEQREAELESRDDETQRRIEELDRQLEGISKRKQELDALEADVSEKLAREEKAGKQLEESLAELESLRARVGEQDQQIDSLSASLEALGEKHEKQTSDFETASSELKSAQSKLRGREIELGERSRALEELAEKAGLAEHELGDARQRYEKQIREGGEALSQAQAGLERERKVSEGLRAQIETLEQRQESGDAEARDRLDVLTQQLAQREQDLEEARARLDSARAQADSSAGEHEQQVASLRRDLEEARSQVQELNTQLAGIGADADEELTRQREQAQRHEQRAGELEGQIGSLRAELTRAQGERDELAAAEDAMKSQLDELRSQLESAARVDPELAAGLERQLEESVQREKGLGEKVEQREAQLKELAERVVELESRPEPDTGMSEEAAAKIEALENQSSELIATIEKLNSELEHERSRPAPPAPAHGAAPEEWAVRRRERLGAVRKRLHADAEKVRLATDALQTRYEQCEQVLTKRAELAEAYEAIASAQRKVRNKEVRSGVLVGLFAMVAITAMLAVGSWFTAGRITPGLYSSRATLVASSSDGNLSEADLATWEAYITGLISEARFLEVASDRMERRGITQYATPGELGTHLEGSLDVVASMPGEIVMEYRAEGAERAQRILDTLVVAISSAANNARVRLGDAAITSVRDNASLTSAPLDTKRLEMAGMIFAGAMALAFVVGGLLWRRLSAAKAKFEDDSRVQVLYEEDQWQMPT